MPFSRTRYYLLSFACVLLVANIFLVHLDLQRAKKSLTFAMLDIGQGDGLFIESPTGTQIMFDGGPARSVLGPLSRVMSPFDKTIDAIVITTPDADPISGGLEILQHYTGC